MANDRMWKNRPRLSCDLEKGRVHEAGWVLRELTAASIGMGVH